MINSPSGMLRSRAIVQAIHQELRFRATNNKTLMMISDSGRPQKDQQ